MEIITSDSFKDILKDVRKDLNSIKAALKSNRNSSEDTLGWRAIQLSEMYLNRLELDLILMVQDNEPYRTIQETDELPLKEEVLNTLRTLITFIQILPETEDYKKFKEQLETGYFWLAG